MTPLSASALDLGADQRLVARPRRPVRSGRDHRPALSRLPGRRSRRRRQQCDHQARWDRRPGLDRYQPAGPRPGPARRHPRQPAARHAQGRHQHERRIPQHHDHGADRPRHRGESGTCRAVAVSAARGPGPVRRGRATRKPPRICGSRSRTPTRQRSAGHSRDATWGLALGGYAGFHTTTPPTPASAIGVYWPALVGGSAVPQIVHLPDSHEIVIPPAAGVPGAASAMGRVRAAAAHDTPAWGDERLVRLPPGRIAGARSGDKGGNANVGL